MSGDGLISLMSRGELDSIALNHGGEVLRLRPEDGVLRRDVSRTNYAGGWRAQWIATEGEPDRGILVLVGGDDRTRGILREGIVRAYERAGLDRAEANTLASTHGPYRREVAGVIADVLRRPAAVEAVLGRPVEMSPRHRLDWLDEYRAVLPDSFLRLHGRRQRFAVDYVQAIVHAVGPRRAVRP